MKITAHLAILAIAFSLLVVLNAGGQQQQSSGPPPTLPASLPIGSETDVFNYIVQNQTNTTTLASFSLFWSVGTTNYQKPSSGSWGGYHSYTEFQSNLVSAGMILVGQTKLEADPSTQITFYGVIYYIYPDNSSYTVYSVLTNIGSLSGITSNTLQAIHPDYTRVILSIPNLQRFDLEVDNGSSPYMNSWSANQAPLFVQPPEMTRSGFLILNQWYSVGTYRARFKLMAGGITNTYTQFGANIVPMPASAQSAELYQASVPKGSDVTILSSTDLSHWQTTTNFPWNMTTNNTVTVPVGFNSSLFYRAAYQ